MQDGIHIYYGGSDDLHGGWRAGSLCLATLRPDGWAGYEPVNAEQAGIVITTPQQCRGKLTLTADAVKGRSK
jgi:hypothetical protein